MGCGCKHGTDGCCWRPHSDGGARMHHHHQRSRSHRPVSSLYGPSFGSGFGSPVAEGFALAGLWLEGIPEDVPGIHPTQLYSHESNLSAIDELGLSGIFVQ
jgi:hypothetical protein